MCGGRGTRLQEHSPAIPKPLIEIGGKPIVWHVMQIYLAQGFRRFVLLTGYRAELIEEFAAREPWPADASVQCLDTGLDTPTGGRLWRASDGTGRRALLRDVRRWRRRHRPPRACSPSTIGTMLGRR